MNKSSRHFHLTGLFGQSLTNQSSLHFNPPQEYKSSLSGRLKSGEPGQVDRVLALHAGNRGFDSYRARFSDPTDQDIRTQCALSWKIVVSEWRSVIAVSLNVGDGARFIKPAKLYICTQKITNITRTDARRRLCAAMVPYR